MNKPKGLRDIIGDAIEGQRPPKKTRPKKFNPANPKRRSIREQQELAKQAKSQGEVVRNRRLKEKYGK
jgi:hypothetical protein